MIARLKFLNLCVRKMVIIEIEIYSGQPDEERANDVADVRGDERPRKPYSMKLCS